MFKSIIHCYLLFLTIPLITRESNHNLQLFSWVNFETDQSSLYFTFGNPDPSGDMKIELLFDLINNETIVIESTNFNRTSINGFSQDQLKDIDSDRGILLQEDISLSERSNISISNFTFRMKSRKEETDHTLPTSHLIPGFESNIDQKDESLLSLSRSPNSFLSQLQASGLIGLKIISITKWGINFGGISFTFGNDHDIIKSPLIDYKNMWAINLFYIIIGKIHGLEPGVNSTIDYTQYDSVFSINLPFVMDTYYHHYITLPYSYEHEFYNKYFINKTKDETCQMVESPSEIRYECDCSSVRDENLNFIVEGVVIELKRSDLTQISGTHQGCLFPILFKQGLEVAVLGRRFVKGFNVVLNDEDKTIGFPEFIHSFPINNFISHDIEHKKGHHRMMIVYCIMSIVLIAGIIVLGNMHMVYFKLYIE